MSFHSSSWWRSYGRSSSPSSPLSSPLRCRTRWRRPSPSLQTRSSPPSKTKRPRFRTHPSRRCWRWPPLAYPARHELSHPPRCLERLPCPHLGRPGAAAGPRQPAPSFSTVGGGLGELSMGGATTIEVAVEGNPGVRRLREQMRRQWGKG